MCGLAHILEQSEADLDILRNRAEIPPFFPYKAASLKAPQGGPELSLDVFRYTTWKYPRLGFPNNSEIACSLPCSLELEICASAIF